MGSEILSIFDTFIGYLQSFLTLFYNLSVSVGFDNYGGAIILMTVVIKMLLYPLTVKQMKSMQQMQKMQPELKKLQQKYKGNPEALQREMAAFYKTAGINPLAGCLPLFAQMPILIGIFYAIRDYEYTGSPHFLWLESLSQADPLYILPVLSALTTYIQQKQMAVDMNQQTKMMMVVMPLFIGWISCTFPSGLVIYWVVSNIMQILQQWWINRSDSKAEGGAA